MEEKHLFLFEAVQQNSNIIIYGLGKVGRSYIQQIEKTRWGYIIGVIDRCIISKKYNNMLICDVKKTPFDYLVIAIEDMAIASGVFRELVEAGIDGGKIVNLNQRYGLFPQPEREKENKIRTEARIAIFDDGGLGDNLISVLFIKKIKECCSNVIINYYSYRKECFARFDFIDKVCEIQKDDVWLKYEKEQYKTVISMHNMAMVEKIDDSLEKKEPLLYRFCEDNKKMHRYKFANSISRYRFTKYSLMMGRNRIEQADIHNILGLSRKDTLSIPIPENFREILFGYGLKAGNYILINRDEGHENGLATKLWDKDEYGILIELLRKKYKYEIVAVGKNLDNELKEKCDRNILGDISFDDLCVILHFSKLFISSEGGLVHLNHFLGGKSVVIYGPTDPLFFSYDENINIYNNDCNERCCWITNDWDKGCLKNDGNKSCMDNITAEMVFREICLD